VGESFEGSARDNSVGLAQGGRACDAPSFSIAVLGIGWPVALLTLHGTALIAGGGSSRSTIDRSIFGIWTAGLASEKNPCYPLPGPCLSCD
jgi:hypothetical protein